ADLDGVIRSVAKKQIKMLVAAARKRHGRLMGQAAKSKAGGAKARFRDRAKSTLEFAAASGRRPEVTVGNAAESYLRWMKRVLEEQAAAKAAQEAAARDKATKAKAAKTSKKAPKKASKNKS